MGLKSSSNQVPNKQVTWLPLFPPSMTYSLQKHPPKYQRRKITWTRRLKPWRLKTRMLCQPLMMERMWCQEVGGLSAVWVCIPWDSLSLIFQAVTCVIPPEMPTCTNFQYSFSNISENQSEDSLLHSSHSPSTPTLTAKPPYSKPPTSTHKEGDTIGYVLHFDDGSIEKWDYEKFYKRIFQCYIHSLHIY